MKTEFIKKTTATLLSGVMCLSVTGCGLNVEETETPVVVKTPEIKTLTVKDLETGGILTVPLGNILTFTVNDVYENFDTLIVDGKEVDIADYYVAQTSVSDGGFIIISIKGQYINDLGVGGHTAVVKTVDGATDEITFTITENLTEEVAEDEKDVDDSPNGNGSEFNSDNNRENKQKGEDRSKSEDKTSYNSNPTPNTGNGNEYGASSKGSSDSGNSNSGSSGIGNTGSNSPKEVPYSYYRDKDMAKSLFAEYNKRRQARGLNALTMDDEMLNMAMKEAERQAEMMRPASGMVPVYNSEIAKMDAAEEKTSEWHSINRHCSDVRVYSTSTANACGNVLSAGNEYCTVNQIMNVWDNSSGHAATLYNKSVFYYNSDIEVDPKTGAGAGVVKTNDGMFYAVIIVYSGLAEKQANQELYRQYIDSQG